VAAPLKDAWSAAPPKAILERCPRIPVDAGCSAAHGPAGPAPVLGAHSAAFTGAEGNWSPIHPDAALTRGAPPTSRGGGASCVVHQRRPDGTNTFGAVRENDESTRSAGVALQTTASPAGFRTKHTQSPKAGLPLAKLRVVELSGVRLPPPACHVLDPLWLSVIRAESLAVPWRGCA
jgi:hypothetical protein